MDQYKYRVLTSMGVPHDYAIALAGGNSRLENAGLKTPKLTSTGTAPANYAVGDVTVTYSAVGAATGITSPTQWFVEPDAPKVRYLGSDQIFNQGAYPSSWYLGSNFYGRGREPIGILEFYTTCAQNEIEVISRSGAATWVWIDDQPMTTAPVARTVTGGGHRLMIAVSNPTVPKKVRLCLFGFEWDRSIRTETAEGKGIAPGPVPTKRIAFEGDSYTQGSATNNLSCWYRRFTERLFKGADARLVAAGGTGYTNPGTTGTLLDRLPGLSMQRADMIHVAAGHNDLNADPEELSFVVELYFSMLREQNPRAEIVVWGPFCTGAQVNSYKATQSTIFTAAKAGDPTVRTIDTLSDPPFTIANHSTYISGDNVHPTQTGSNYLGDWTAGKYVS